MYNGGSQTSSGCLEVLVISLKHYSLASDGVSLIHITWCQNGQILAKMEALKAPDPLRLERNIADNWKKWKQKFRLYMTATGIEGKSQKVQSSTLLHVIGDEALEIYNTFEFTQQEDRLKLKVLLDKFEEHFTPHRNVTFERRVQHSCSGSR